MVRIGREKINSRASAGIKGASGELFSFCLDKDNFYDQPEAIMVKTIMLARTKAVISSGDIIQRPPKF